MAHAGTSDPVLRLGGHQKEDQLAQQFVNRTEQWQNKAQAKKPEESKTPGKQDGSQKQKKEPAGGFDATPIPKAPVGYTLKFTFHGANNLPFSDFNSLSSDPYIIAILRTDLQKRHKQDPDLVLRTRTIHRNTNPRWETEWVVANVPASGFFLKCRLYDEDPADHDDRLGNAHVRVDTIDGSWQGFRERKFDIKKRMGSKRAYLFRGCAAMFNRNIKMGGDLVVSIENMGRTEADNGGRMWTVGPLAWSRHYSPMIGRLARTKDVSDGPDGEKPSERYNFQAVQMQFAGPVPEKLYHRYVEFKPFVAGMFTSHSLRGRILNRALHHQHARIYNYDRSTLYGFFPQPCIEMTKQFLDFVHYDQGGRIFTYIMTLDGMWRFTETGKEFGIDLLSKHTMHSNVSIYIAFSGEFFIRRLKRPHHISRKESKQTDKNGGDPEAEALEPAPEPEDEGRPASAERRDPEHYELIIDNDSGTYRPNAKMLGTWREYLERNLPGLRVVTLDCGADAEKMDRLKSEQRKKKSQSQDGKQVTYMQNHSQSSISSSEEEELTDRAQAQQREDEKQTMGGGFGMRGATKEKAGQVKGRADGVKDAAGGLAMLGKSGAKPQKSDGKPSDGEGGYVGDDPPVVRHEKGQQEEYTEK